MRNLLPKKGIGGLNLFWSIVVLMVAFFPKIAMAAGNDTLEEKVSNLFIGISNILFLLILIAGLFKFLFHLMKYYFSSTPLVKTENRDEMKSTIKLTVLLLIVNGILGWLLRSVWMIN
ncbi:hypothetical protein ACIFOT_13335 [Neobacillus sp. NRS-1170]|uniref:hypothetical protein n=1 Tax=Neobacillus sp. NRS-1170 TaxID=3233898 RepID=UPI003D287745